MPYTALPLDEYQKLAQRTEPEANHKDPQRQLLNAALGLIAEVGEIGEQLKKHIYQGHALDGDNLLEEIGDSNWYVAQLCWSRSWVMSDMVRSSYVPNARVRGIRGMQWIILRLAKQVGVISSTVEGHVFEGYALAAQDLKNALGRVIYDLEALAHILGSSGDRCRESNISKLRLRFPAGFSSEASIKREDKQ